VAGDHVLELWVLPGTDSRRVARRTGPLVFSPAPDCEQVHTEFASACCALLLTSVAPLGIGCLPFLASPRGLLEAHRGTVPADGPPATPFTIGAFPRPRDVFSSGWVVRITTDSLCRFSIASGPIRGFLQPSTPVSSFPPSIAGPESPRSKCGP